MDKYVAYDDKSVYERQFIKWSKRTTKNSDGSSWRPRIKLEDNSVICRASGTADAWDNSENKILLFLIVGWIFITIERRRQTEQNLLSAVNWPIKWK